MCWDNITSRSAALTVLIEKWSVPMMNSRIRSSFRTPIAGSSLHSLFWIGHTPTLTTHQEFGTLILAHLACVGFLLAASRRLPPNACPSCIARICKVDVRRFGSTEYDETWETSLPPASIALEYVWTSVSRIFLLLLGVARVLTRSNAIYLEQLVSID